MAHNATMDPDAPVVYEQFEHIDQQQESYVLGMWAFLVTEVMFFGALFFTYAIYRWKHHDAFYLAHKSLSVEIGAVNTTILLASSLAVAMAVHYAQKRNDKATIRCLWFTVLCAVAFLVIKISLEWLPKFQHGYAPTPEFIWTYKGEAPVAEGRLFYSLYFAMTGLHGVHVLVGIGVFVALIYLIKSKAPTVTDHIPTELCALYWHFVDLVWIFLYPLFYLIPK